MRKVTIIKGIGRGNRIVENMTFPLLKNPKTEDDGRISIRVDGTNSIFEHHNTKIFVENTKDFIIMNDENNVSDNIVNIKHETEEEIDARISETFEVLEKITSAVSKGYMKSIIISGAAGMGKSKKVVDVLEKEGLVEKYTLTEGMSFVEDEENGNHDEENRFIDEILETGKKVFDVSKGHITASALFELLYRNRYENCTLVLDDIDSIFHDEKALNILKAALDTSEKRRITWASMGGRRDGVPSVFEYKGNIIFISNKDFDNMKEKASVGKHIEALMSRCLFLNLKINTVKEKIIRIKQVAIKEGLFDHNGVTDIEKQKEIMEWVKTNSNNFRELSLRTIVHISSISKMDGWKKIAKNTLLV